MKKLMAIIATLAMVAGATRPVSAGDREWATAGKILTGVVAGTVIASAIEPAPVYVYPAATWYTPPPQVYVSPAPVVTYPARVCVQPAPVVIYHPPPPVITFSVGFGGGWHHRPHHRFCR